MNREHMLAAIEKAPDGLVEVYAHPATADRFPGSARGYRYRDELAALVDPEVIAAVKRSRRRTARRPAATGTAASAARPAQRR